MDLFHAILADQLFKQNPHNDSIGYMDKMSQVKQAPITNQFRDEHPRLQKVDQTTFQKTEEEKQRLKDLKKAFKNSQK